MKQDSIANAFTGLLTVCALIVVTLVMRREFFPPQTPSVATSYPQPRVLTEWRDLASVGHVIGSPKARLKIVELSDFQCPFCNDLHLTLKLLLARHPGEIAVVYRHFPLPARMHPFAQAAAIASECAAAQHKFVEYHDALFERQDSIGTHIVGTLRADRRCAGYRALPLVSWRGLGRGSRFERPRRSEAAEHRGNTDHHYARPTHFGRTPARYT